MLSFRVNRIEEVHRSLSALYRATDGDNWHNTTNWQFTTVPSAEELAAWYGVRMTAGWLTELQLHENNLTGMLPPELGNFAWLQALYLQGNTLTGAIPTALGNLTRLQELRLNENSLAGAIPSALGKLTQLQVLLLNDNFLAGAIPSELGNLTQLEYLNLNNNMLTGMLPRSLMQLDSLKSFHFGGQELCAPRDDEFQAWLSSIPDVDGPTCGALQFESRIENLTFTMGVAISAFVLPEASGGVQPYTYTLEPALPAGLVFDETTRTISGNPTEVSPSAPYTYSAMDNGGSSGSLTFTMEVVGAVALADEVEDQSYPRAHPVTPLVLPEATGGLFPIHYTLTPTLPAGLDFDPSTRTISGTPTAVTAGPVPYTYKATDANGSADSVQFHIDVYSPLPTKHTQHLSLIHI